MNARLPCGIALALFILSRWLRCVVAPAMAGQRLGFSAKHKGGSLCPRHLVSERRTDYLDRDNRSVGVVIVRSKYEIASINEVFCERLGYEKADLARATLIDIAHPAEQEKCKQLLIEAANDKDAAYQTDLSFVAKNGETVRTKLIVTAARDQYETADILVSFEDFLAPHARKTSPHGERLTQVEASVKVFMHELRNQMHGVSLIAQSIEQESTRHGLAEDDPLVTLNQNLRMRLKDIGKLLEDLSSLGESIKLELQPTDLAKFMTTLLASEQASHVGERIRINWDIAADVPLVQLDHRRFKQAWLNLFKNAVEAMPSGGTITVRLYRLDEYVCLEIEDSGIGVPDGIDIFEPSTTTKPQGTGLGLGIVREIVSAHGGVVSYQSVPQTGARFTVSLPVDVTARCHGEKS